MSHGLGDNLNLNEQIFNEHISKDNIKAKYTFKKKK
jgi:hypothetical protein